MTEGYRFNLLPELFDQEVWLAICSARLRARQGHHSPWYHVLRTHCGYTSGSPVKLHMEALCDAWIDARPAWIEGETKRLLHP